MISRGVEISIVGGGGEMVRALFQSPEVEERWFVCYTLVIFFLLFFCNHAGFVLRYKQPHAALAIERKQTYKQLPRPASPLHGKNQGPQIHRKSRPRLEPKIKTSDK